jgi:hypothetical protein
MNSKKRTLFPEYLKIWGFLGENFKRARKRRKLTTSEVSEREGIDRTARYQIKRETLSYHWALILTCFAFLVCKMIF